MGDLECRFLHLPLTVVKLHPITSVTTALMWRYRQRTGESLHPERSHKAPAWLGSVESSSSPALGVRAPCDPRPCPAAPQRTECTHWRSIFQQVSVQIHVGLVNVARYGTQRSPVWAQQHRHRLLPVAEGDAGALRRETREDSEQEKSVWLVIDSLLQYVVIVSRYN